MLIQLQLSPGVVHAKGITDYQDLCFSGSKDYISCTRQTERADHAYLEMRTGKKRSIKLEDTNNNVYSNLQVCGPLSHSYPLLGSHGRTGYLLRISHNVQSFLSGH